ncbi:hypothetical protein LTR53_001076 [Teratosphaeriaceae sp. CCFEE 6253]|nr:hypothetical protein LTR53_001076 [Teratosphaeriaceae sp. CCFEE 6253]
MLHSNQIGVELCDARWRPIQEHLNDCVAGLDDYHGRAHSALICEDAGARYVVCIDISRRFDLHGADGVLLSISQGGATHTADHAMTDTQMLYIPRQGDGMVAGKSVVSSFTKWSKSGRDTVQDFATPEPSAHLRPGLPSYTIRQCANGHQGAITVTLQRVNDEKRPGNYIIRRADPSHDIATVPPERYRWVNFIAMPGSERIRLLKSLQNQASRC